MKLWDKQGQELQGDPVASARARAEADRDRMRYELTAEALHRRALAGAAARNGHGPPS